jgi:hypothetical protein
MAILTKPLHLLDIVATHHGLSASSVLPPRLHQEDGTILFGSQQPVPSDIEMEDTAPPLSPQLKCHHCHHNPQQHPIAHL